MAAGASEARDGLVARIARSESFLGKQSLDLLAGLRAIEQDGAPALPIGHFFVSLLRA